MVEFGSIRFHTRKKTISQTIWARGSDDALYLFCDMPNCGDLQPILSSLKIVYGMHLSMTLTMYAMF